MTDTSNMSNTSSFEDLIPDEADRPAKKGQAQKDDKPFKIFAGSKLPVGKAVGPMWKKKVDAATHAHSTVLTVWEECFKYYNHHQMETIQTERGTFKRGDGTENVIHSTINITLPAVYSKNPDVTCATQDGEDELFCEALQAFLNALLRRQDCLNAKPKVKRATGLALLTNFGVLKLDFTKKDDSREFALQEMERLTKELKTAAKSEDVDRIWGEFEALEMNMEVRKPSGFALYNTLPQNLIVDAYAEMPNGDDAGWMAERVWLSTAMLTARYTQKGKGESEGDRVLIYKPTHKAVFSGDNSRDDGLGLVLNELNASDTDVGNVVVSHTEDERRAYLNMYYTECYYVWDKTFRRVYLFHRDDWAWPIWVWDDPLNTTRFFPYFFMSFSFNTGGMVNVGDTAFILDQQDHINDINRQASRIRRSVFDYFFYDTDKFDKDSIEALIDAIRGETKTDQHAIGVKNLDGKPVKDAIEAFAPPAIAYKELFDKKPILDGMDRQTNTSDAIRGVQFATNTNVEAVNTYQQSMQLSIGAKVDVVEDCMTDLCRSVAEISVQNYDETAIAGFIGAKLAAGWKEMSLEEFISTYSVEITPGSTEKPTSVFKKKEALEIVQAVGQFATAAPAATLMIMLRVLSKAFTDVNIHDEDWAALQQEAMANLQRGNSTGQQPGAQPGQPGPGGSQGTTPQDQSGASELDKLPPDSKQRIVQLAKQPGISDQAVEQAIHEELAKIATGAPNGAANGRQPAGGNRVPSHGQPGGGLQQQPRPRPGQ